MKPLVACLVVAALMSPPAAAQAPSKDELLRRTSDYISRFVAGLSNVVAEEQYEQSFEASAPRRRLKSDFLLVKYPGKDTEFLAFRDVTEVDGRPVANPDRLLKLFVEPFTNPLERAIEITNDGRRHSLERARLVSPLFVMSILQAEYQGRYRFSLGGLATKLGPDVRELELFEPTNTPAAAAQPLRAVAWIEQATGRVVKTELRVGKAPNTALTTTIFGRDAGLGIDVPLELHDSYLVFGRLDRQDQFIGTAKYGRFRRFQVRVEETIERPAPSPQ